MNRREFVTAASLGVAGLLAQRVIGAAAGGAKAPRMNLLVIHTDEHNFRTLGCYRKRMEPEQARVWGDKAVVATPNIDRIAAGGATCTKFYATTPVCSPSRAAFVTGRYPQNTPVTTNNVPMADDVVTFAEVLRKAGYATGYAGKWHLDGTGKPQWAPKRTFGFADNRYMFNRGHWKQLEDTQDGPRVKARSGGRPSYSVVGADEESFTTDFLAGKTVEFIRAHTDEPFCYMVSIPDPHGPNTVRPPYDTAFDGMAFEEPRTMNKPDSAVPGWAPREARTLNPGAMQKYFGMVRCIDDNVGKVLDELDKLGLADRTIVVFTADHGDLCGEHGRHNKGVPYETSAKIPFVIRAPGLIQPGTVVHEALGCVDFAPTMLALLGHKAPPKTEGRDASALLAGKRPAEWKDVVFLRAVSSPGAAGNWVAAVTKRHKLVLSRFDKPWLLDLETDPDEVRNFVDDPARRDVLRRLAKELLAYGRAHKDPTIEDPAIKADLEWAVTAEGPYQGQPRVPRKTGGGKKKARRKAKEKQ